MARRPRLVPPRLALQGIVFLAVVVALASYHSLLTGAAWWFVVAGIVLIVSLAMGLAHRVARRPVWPPFAGLVAAVLAITLFFAPGTALFFIVPGFSTAGAFVTLVRGGMDSIATQGTPAEPTVGIVFLLAAGFAVVTVLVDLLAFTVRRPALVGIPLLALIAVPALIDPSISEPVFFVLLAAAYLVLILVAQGRRQNRIALGVGATAIVGALLVTLAIPPVDTSDTPSSQLRGYSTGVNPFINLGTDLRRPSPITALTYTTTAQSDQYLTMSVLEDFTGGTWQPTVDRSGETDLTAIGPAPGRSNGAAVASSTTTITVGNITGGWLPAPYAPTKVTGQSGDWQWDPTTLAIGSDRSTIRGQKYTVASDMGTPNATQLNASGTEVDRTALAKDLTLPARLPPIVSSTAQQVVDAAGATTDYTMALALQNYFLTDGFTYSTTAPVDEGYDGSSASVIATFLTKKAGYCVHFSSAMAVMARALGIPARISVGFTTGDSAFDPQLRRNLYTVSTDDLHAWPELYFEGVGWVRFEPTPGRGNVPDYGTIGDPTSTSSASAPASTPTPTRTQVPTDAATNDTTSTPAPGSAEAVRRVAVTALPWIAIVVVVLLLLLLPAIIRRSRRVRRLARIRASGAPLEAWAELRDTAFDLGLESTDAATPRAFATALSMTMTPGGADSLARLLAAVEADAYSASSIGATVADLRETTAALRASATRGQRWRARFTPASVLGRRRHSSDVEDD